MAIKVTVSTGKTETPRTSAGLIKRAPGEDTSDKHPQVSVTELVSALFSEVRRTLDKEAEIEVEITANIEITNKDGDTAINLDVSGESSSARTLKLKFNSKLNPA